MAEITMNDLKNTYVKLLKDVPVYKNHIGGENNGPVWWTKRKGEIAGKVWMWAAPGMSGDMPNIKNSYLIFKLNDDFNNPNAYLYFIKFDKGMIDWEYSRQQLATKQYLDMSLWERFTTNMEKSIIDAKNDVVNNVKSALKTGLSIVAGVLLVRFVIIPEVKFRRQKKMFVDIAKELKK